MKLAEIDLFTRKPVPPPTWRERYEALLKSEFWRNLKRQKLAIVHGCQRCPRRTQLQLHHLHYERQLGCETLEDVEIVCSNCHRQADRERELEGEEQQRIGLLRSRWAKRHFGTAWREVPTDVIEEEWQYHTDCDREVEGGLDR